MDGAVAGRADRAWEQHRAHRGGAQPRHALGALREAARGRVATPGGHRGARRGRGRGVGSTFGASARGHAARRPARHPWARPRGERSARVVRGPSHLRQSVRDRGAAAPSRVVFLETGGGPKPPLGARRPAWACPRGWLGSARAARAPARRSVPSHRVEGDGKARDPAGSRFRAGRARRRVAGAGCVRGALGGAHGAGAARSRHRRARGAARQTPRSRGSGGPRRVRDRAPGLRRARLGPGPGAQALARAARRHRHHRRRSQRSRRARRGAARARASPSAGSEGPLRRPSQRPRQTRGAGGWSPQPSAVFGAATRGSFAARTYAAQVPRGVWDRLAPPAPTRTAARPSPPSRSSCFVSA